MKMKKINTQTEKEVKIKNISKKELIENDINVKDSVFVDSKNHRNYYMIYGFQKAREKYGIDYETIIVINYLYELSLFPLTISISDRNIIISDYISLGLIMEDFSVKNKSLYRLTEKSKQIISDYNYWINNYAEIIMDNREVEVSPEIKMKSVLSKILKK